MEIGISLFSLGCSRVSNPIKKHEIPRLIENKRKKILNSKKRRLFFCLYYFINLNAVNSKKDIPVTNEHNIIINTSTTKYLLNTIASINK